MKIKMTDFTFSPRDGETIIGGECVIQWDVIEETLEEIPDVMKPFVDDFFCSHPPQPITFDDPRVEWPSVVERPPGAFVIVEMVTDNSLCHARARPVYCKFRVCETVEIEATS